MQFLKTLSLQNFKGIESCNVQFNELTILSGLNNSGKTSILQAIKLLADSVPKIQVNQYFLHDNPDNRVLDVKTLAATFGIPDASWLLRANQDPTTFKMSATFANNLQIVVTAQNANLFTFRLPHFTQSTLNEAKQKLNEVSQWAAELILPPGIVASREDMIPGNKLAHMVSQGKGSQYWRNNLFWSIQDGGIERFERVKELVEDYFPDVRVEIPVLDSKTNPPGILMKFQDASGAKLDISQSGSGLRTFLTLA